MKNEENQVVFKEKKSGTKEGDDICERNVRENVESGITGSVEPEEMATVSVSTSASDSTSKVYKFKSDWIKLFPWLEFENNLMFCKYCKGQKQAGNSAFATGNPHLKKDSPTKHNHSKRHIACRDMMRQNKPASTVTAALERQVMISEVEMRRQLKIKMNIAYFIAKEQEPFVKFGPLITLHKKNGVDIQPTKNHVR